MSPLVGPAAGVTEHEHRNSVFLPSDEPFVVDLDDQVVPPVITAEQRDRS
jgi:hypothetical protein